MAKINLDKMSLKELLKLQDDVATAITAAQKSQRADALAAAKKAAADHGFNLGELMGDTKKVRKEPLPAKYQHPENPAKTWSGRGRQPDWIKEAVAKGQAMEDFLIT